MPDGSTTDGPDASPDEQVLADLFRDLDRALDRPRDLADALRQHPHLAGEIQELYALRCTLDGSRGHVEPPLPQRLGEFRIDRRIDTGGMGEVYEAWQESLGRRVAVKVLRQGHTSPATRERFEREQQALARLHQVNIVPIHAKGREGPIEYFAMAYIDGATLRHVMQAASEHSSAKPGTRTPSIAQLIGPARLAAETTAHAAVPTAASSPAPVFRPSREYLRSVARVMAEAARGVQHAHDQGVLHRDVKPSNIMVEVDTLEDGTKVDKCWLIDFGLASCPGEAGRAAGAHAGDAPPVVSGVMGTPAYMAPEQFEERADSRTDVWGLGVTLYELLTLRRAFPVPEGAGDAERLAGVREAVRRADPPWARGLVPRDLQAICRRAMRKDPAARYATADALAEDLRRWLRCEAVVARCQEAPLLAAPLRCKRWAQRNKGWASALGISLASIVVVMLMAWLDTQSRRRHAERAALLQQIELLSSQPHKPGWSDDARRLALTMEDGAHDEGLRDAVTATFAGLDARWSLRREGEVSSSMAFDGASLLLGGAPATQRTPAIGARSWDPAGVPKPIGLQAPGPVACRPDGTRVQFVSTGPLSFQTWDMTRGVPIATWSFVAAGAAVDHVAHDALQLPKLAMAADASVVAAILEGPEEAASVAAWDATTGALLRSFARPASALALSADGRRLAAGNVDGRVSAWDLRTGESVAELSELSDEVQSLAFGVNPASGRERDFLLAAGCPSGRLVVWDSARQRVRATCRGLCNRILALAFSPDGALLAGAGAGALLWDSATGERLLFIGGTMTSALAFSADGRRLAVGHYPAFEGFGSTEVWELQFDRGVRNLRGLDMAVQVFAVSPDGRRVAGLSTEWRLAVWDVATAATLLVVDAPKGLSGDNAGLAFSRDGTRLACMTGSEARLWDIDEGALLHQWPLQPGLIDRLSFDARGDLIAARCEPLVPDDPRGLRVNAVVRVRTLSRGNGGELLLEVADFPSKVTSMVLDPEGRYLVIEGATSTLDAKAIAAYEIPSGRRLWIVLCDKDRDVSSLQIDATGEFVSYTTDMSGVGKLVAMPLGTPVAMSVSPSSLGPHADFVACKHAGDTGRAGAALLLRDASQAFLRLRDAESSRVAMDRSGHLVVFDRGDSLVQVAVLAEVRDALAAAGLAWNGPAGQ